MLGFADVYDYVPGKVDWLAHNLEVEGDDPEPTTVGGLMRDDVVRCAPADHVTDVLASIKASPYPFGPKTFRPHHSAENVAKQLADKNLRWAIVTTPEGRLLGVASREDLERAS